MTINNMPDLKPTDTVHLFELAGLGKAPFTFIGECDRGARNHTTCDYCGTCIRYEQTIKSADGILHKVGCECINKSGDTGLITGAKLAAKQRREELARARFEARMKAVAEREQAERYRNGGLTDYELEQERKAQAEAERVAKVTDGNQWLIDELSTAYQGDFIKSMMSAVTTGTPYQALSYRCKRVICDILAKRCGRANSKAYRSEYERIEARFWPDDEA